MPKASSTAPDGEFAESTPMVAGAPDDGATGLKSLGLSQRERLDQIISAGLVDRGAVFILSLEPVMIQLGRRWEARKDQVWEHVERTLSQSLPTQDVFLRVDDTSVVVAVASTAAYEGQARCIAVLRRIIHHFLGRSGDDDIRLSRLRGLVGDDLIAEPVDLLAADGLAFGDIQPQQRSADAIPPQAWTPPLGGRSYAAPFTDLRGDPVSMEIRVEPVWSLRRSVISSYALRRVFPASRAPTNDLDQEAADLQVILRLVDILGEYRRAGGMFAIHVPLHFATVAGRRARITLLGRCADVLPLMRQVVVFEIENIDPGIPGSRLQEAVSMIRPFGRAVVAGVREGVGLNSHIGGCGMGGVAIAARASGGHGKALRHLIARARAITPNVVVHGVKLSPAIEQQLMEAGATHASSQAAAATEVRAA